MHKNISLHLPTIYTPHEFPIDFPVCPSYDRMVHTKEPEYFHFHNCFEIGYCISGKGQISFEACQLEFQPDEFTIIPPLEPHITVSPEPPTHWDFLYFDPTVLYAASDPAVSSLFQRFYQFQELPLQVTQKSNPFLYQILCSLFEEFHNTQLFYNNAASALILILLSELNKIPSSQQPIADAASAPVRNALLRIFSHYAEPLSIPDLAEFCGLSESHFRRIFKQMIGISPQDYLHNYRIQHACQLIMQNKESLNQIATLVGYSSVSSFNRQFLKSIGMTPSAWKKNCKAPFNEP